jgi:hypothetical protein
VEHGAHFLILHYRSDPRLEGAPAHVAHERFAHELHGARDGGGVDGERPAVQHGRARQGRRRGAAGGEGGGRQPTCREHLVLPPWGRCWRCVQHGQRDAQLRPHTPRAHRYVQIRAVGKLCVVPVVGSASAGFGWAINGLYRAEIATLSPASAGPSSAYRSEPAAQLLPISPGSDSPGSKLSVGSQAAEVHGSDEPVAPEPPRIGAR